jgi:hypothetical protein
MTGQPYERCAVIAVIQPINGNNATTLSGAFDMSKYEEALVIIQIGVVDQTVDCKVRQSATSGGTYSDISGKAITQFAATDDGKTSVINLKASDFDSDKPWGKVSVTVANGTSSLLSVVVLGFKPRIAPNTADDLSTVSEVVT